LEPSTKVPGTPCGGGGGGGEGGVGGAGDTGGLFGGLDGVVSPGGVVPPELPLLAQAEALVSPLEQESGTGTVLLGSVNPVSSPPVPSTRLPHCPPAIHTFPQNRTCPERHQLKE